jgi:hypothetical protein
MGMDQKEVALRVKALEKAHAQNESADNIIAILKELRTNVVPTKELLRV